MNTPVSGNSPQSRGIAKPSNSSTEAPESVTSRPSAGLPEPSSLVPYRLSPGSETLTASDLRGPMSRAEGEVTSAAPLTAQRSGMEWAPQATAQRMLWRRAADGLDSITVDPAVQDGRPVICGTRIALSQVLDTLADVGGIDAVLEQFPGELDARAVEEMLVFVARLVR